MDKIRVLPETLQNKIAAGEVVDRPASVLKELVENSVDAGSTAIEVSLNKGGCESIRVKDNGSGMIRDEALLALERHATSKISSEKDLSEIDSMGFRGEALPSIASVSRMKLKTMPEDADIATVIAVEGGEIKNVKKSGGVTGTTVEVKDLFYNVPARKKFLKTIRTELRHCVTILQKQALAFPGISFTLRSGNRERFNLSKSDLPTRIFELFGEDTMDKLLEVKDKTGKYALRGFVSNPQLHYSSTNKQHIFVNKRPVTDKAVSHAVRTAYEDLPDGRYPFIVLFLKVPASKVDVNVHPAKSEVKFRESGLVHDFVQKALKETLSSGEVTGDPTAAKEAQLDDYRKKIKDSTESYIARKLEYGKQTTSDTGKAKDLTDFDTKETSGGKVKRPSSRPDIIGQYRNTYIVGMDEKGLVLIDQHVAHERVLFEKMRQNMETKDTKKQVLLTPETLEISSDDYLKFKDIKEEIEKTGFEVEDFGKNTVSIKAVPTFLSGADFERTFRDIIDSAGEKELQKEILVTLSCHGAVKKNTSLDSEKMEYILDKLFQTEMPTICPHGRPIMIRYLHRDIERDFDRK